MNKILGLFFLLIPFITEGQIITTIAGAGVSGSTGDGGPASAAKIGTTGYLAFDSSGNYYFGEYPNKIRKVSSLGIITTFAGTAVAGFSGDGGPASVAQINFPQGIAVDEANNVYISDTYNNRIRKIDVITGIITTVVGKGTPGFSGDGGPATAAELWFPFSVTFDTAGNLYISDANNIRIRRVDTHGIITTIAGNGIMGHTGDGGPATSAEIYGSEGMRVDNWGNLYFADQQVIRKINLTTGIINSVAGCDTVGYSGNGGPATAAKMWLALDVLPDNCGNFYISEEYNNVIRTVDTSGIISTIAGDGSGGYIGGVAGFSGDGGPATVAQLDHPRGIAFDKNGDLVILDDANFRIRKVTILENCDIPLKEKILHQKNTLSITIYPNPVGTTLTLSTSNKITDITISNLLGQLLKANECNSDKVQIDVADLPSGVYLVRINGTEVRRFVKQ